MHATGRATHTLNIAFVSPDDGDHWLNRLTARASTHPLCHVEIHFETTNQCFSIIADDRGASLRTKSLGNPSYRIVSLGVTTSEYNTCLMFCQTASTWGLSFDEQGMWRSYFCCGCCEPSSQQVGRTFCSKIVTEALQYAGVPEVDRLNPATATPSRLYEALYRSPRIVCASVPYKREALALATGAKSAPLGSMR